MPSFEFYILNEYYNRYLKDNDRLAKVASLIDWELHDSLIQQKPHREGRRERPNIDPIVMLKLLVLQQWHGLSDPDLLKYPTPGSEKWATFSPVFHSCSGRQEGRGEVEEKRKREEAAPTHYYMESPKKLFFKGLPLC